jgi:hypothetical protein
MKVGLCDRQPITWRSTLPVTRCEHCFAFLMAPVIAIYDDMVVRIDISAVQNSFHKADVVRHLVASPL